MSVMTTTRSNGVPDDACEDTADHLAGTPFPAPNGKLVRLQVALVRLQVAPAASEQRVLAVEFLSADGQCWNAIGGGATVAAAIVDARESCPDDATWDAVSWYDLYGE